VHIQQIIKGIRVPVLANHLELPVAALHAKAAHSSFAVMWSPMHTCGAYMQCAHTEQVT
jgi:hypothetical protein